MKTSKLINLSIIAAAIISLTVTSCSKDKNNNPANPDNTLPKLSIELDHLAGNQKFYFDSTYTTGFGDQITADLFKYYISNIVLVGVNNQEYAVPNTYFLVNHSDAASQSILMENLPAGQFKSMKFMIGVDSTSCVSGAQTGALDPVNGMFWDWNSGYIFMKLEGTSPSISSGGFTFHIGGYKGMSINNRVVELSFDGDVLNLINGGHPEVHIVVDVLELFTNPNTIDFSTFPTSVVMANSYANMLADNYASGMFRYDHIHAE